VGKDESSTKGVLFGGVGEEIILGEGDGESYGKHAVTISDPRG
jgi:hypothetical protein